MIRRQLPLILAVIWIAALFGVRSVVAGPTPALFYEWSEHYQFEVVSNQSPNYTTYNCGYEPFGPTPPAQDNCDPSLWVVNPLRWPNDPPCVWDGDDRVQRNGWGQIGGQATVSDSICILSANSFHHTHVLIGAPVSSLVVTLHFEPQDVTFTVPPGPGAGSKYGYRFCLTGPVYHMTSPALQPVADSNGGVAVPTTVTLSIKNTLNKAIKPVAAYFRVGNINPSISPCRQSSDLFHAADDDSFWRLYNG